MMMRMMVMTIVVKVMTIPTPGHPALITLLFNLQIQLSAAVSSAIFSHVHVMKFVKEENILQKVMKSGKWKN